jgi:hypothetical protein
MVFCASVESTHRVARLLQLTAMYAERNRQLCDTRGDSSILGKDDPWEHVLDEAILGDDEEEEENGVGSSRQAGSAARADGEKMNKARSEDGESDGEEEEEEEEDDDDDDDDDEEEEEDMEGDLEEGMLFSGFGGTVHELSRLVPVSQREAILAAAEHGEVRILVCTDNMVCDVFSTVFAFVTTGVDIAMFCQFVVQLDSAPYHPFHQQLTLSTSFFFSKRHGASTCLRCV